MKTLIEMLSRRRDGKFWPKKGTRRGKTFIEDWRRLKKNCSLLKITWNKFCRNIIKRKE